jgi:hypothetical protein
MSKELTMGVYYEKAQERKQDLTESLSGSNKERFTNDLYNHFEDRGWDKFDTVETLTKAMTLSLILDTNICTGENNNMVIPKDLIPEKVVSLLEPFDLGNNLEAAVRDRVLARDYIEPYLVAVNTAGLISESIDGIDHIDPELRALVPNDQELAASLAIDIIGENNFIVPRKSVSGEEYEMADYYDISADLSDSFKQGRIDKYMNEHEQQEYSYPNVTLHKFENGKDIIVTDPSEKEDIMKIITDVTGLKFE